ncbi:heme exporter protein CcmD [Phyllobacterium phragmitis]|uniref:Heme exporter protein D n=1 Tax=Phyllobacterium phragmitis TaxID=2670329 RepID=A0A2S9ISD6_9HYPH|nr:heme exporter protein CcmD [Phyllobacterium phragmitis]PRD43443.1 heme exporter protein CcmD [Phyllobacterium phragmitis]
MSHLAFVLLSYGVSALVLSGVVAWLLIDQRAQRTELQRLEAQGIRRRSQKAQQP